MRILLVEDEPEMSRLIARSVGAMGIAVDCVASIAEAVAASAIGSHAVVLLDRRLPDGDVSGDIWEPAASDIRRPST